MAKRLIGIVRVDNPDARQLGHLARIEHRTRKYSKWFGDYTHGGRARALKAAELWVVRTRRRIGAPVKREGLR